MTERHDRNPLLRQFNDTTASRRPLGKIDRKNYIHHERSCFDSRRRRRTGGGGGAGGGAASSDAGGGVDDGGVDVRLHGRTGADQVAVAVDVVDAAHAWPHLGLGSHEGLAERKKTKNTANAKRFHRHNIHYEQLQSTKDRFVDERNTRFRRIERCMEGRREIITAGKAASWRE